MSELEAENELLKIQRKLQSHLLKPHSYENSFQEDQQCEAHSFIVETEYVPKSVRLHIYENAYRARFVDAMSTDFDKLHAYLGDDAFVELIHAYIEKHPSHYFSLRGVGGELVNFLKTTSPYAEHIELHELAAFEWALCYAFDAADQALAIAADYSALPAEQWSDLTLKFVPALRVISLRSNAPLIWKALNNDESSPFVEIYVESQSWIIWRRDLKLLFRPLDVLEKIALDGFVRSDNFAEVCSELSERLPENEVPQYAARFLQQWISDGLIAAL